MGFDGRGTVAGNGTSRQGKVGISATRPNGNLRLQVGVSWTKGASVSSASVSSPEKGEGFLAKAFRIATLALFDTGVSGDIDVGNYTSLDPSNPADFTDMEGRSNVLGGSLGTPADPDLTIDAEVVIGDNGIVGGEVGLGVSALTPTPVNITAERSETEVKAITVEIPLPEFLK